MSAQAVLSMIAPVLPATPQGPSGGDASEFQGLLASMLPGGALAGAAVKAAKPTEGLATEVEAEPAGTVGDLVAAPGLLTIPSPVPSAQPAVSPVEESVQPQAEEAIGPDSAPATPAPALPQDERTPPVATVQAEAPLPSIQPPSIGTPARKDAQKAAVSPPAAAAVAAGVDLAPAPKEVPVVTADPKEVVAVPAGSKAAAPSETPVPIGASRTAPQPPLPLRPLTERTSQPLDGSGNGSAMASESADGRARAQTPASPQTGAPSDSAIRSTAPTPPINTAQPAADGNPVDAPPSADPDTAAAQAESTAPVREHQPSTLSRAALDATVQIAAQIARKLEGRSTRFEIALRPDELGRVDVKLDIDSEGRLAARLAFDNPAAATDLRGRADELRRQLENAGFQLADDAFEFAERDSGSSAFDRGQDAQQGQNRAFRASARLNAEIDVAQPPRWLSLSLSPSGVDMKV